MCTAAIMDAEDIAGEEEELHRLRKLHHCIVTYRPLPCNGERRCEQTYAPWCIFAAAADAAWPPDQRNASK